MLDLDLMLGIFTDHDRIVVRRRDRKMRSESERTLYLIASSIRGAGETSGKPITVDRDIQRLWVGNSKSNIHVETGRPSFQGRFLPSKKSSVTLSEQEPNGSVPPIVIVTDKLRSEIVGESLTAIEGVP